MATLAEQRLASRTRERDRSDFRVRNASEAVPKDTYYRPEYGWVMSDAQVKKEQEVEGTYNKATADATAKVKQNDADYQAAIARGSGDINSAYDEAISASKKPTMDLVPVRVVNGNTIEGTYMLPKSTVDDLNSNTFNKGSGSYVGNWVDNGANYNIDVRTNGGKVMGKEIHDSLRTAQDQVNKTQQDNENAYKQSLKNAEAERQSALSGFSDTSSKSYADAKNTWNAELNQVSGSYAKRLASGKAAYDDSKQKYSDSVSGVDIGLLESPTNRVKLEVQ